MGIRANRVNINFEDQVNNPNNTYDGSFDYIYFLISDETIPLYSQIEFSDEYLEHLKFLGFRTEFVASADEVLDWWAPRSEPDIVNKLNSKVFVHEYLHSNQIAHPDAHVVHSMSELDNVESQYNLIRLEYSVAGKGTFLRNSRKIKHFPVLVTELKNRQLDIGTKFHSNGFFHYINIVDSSFCFRGQLFISNEKHSEKFSNLLSQLSQMAEKLQRSIRKDFSIKEFQCDSFVYEASDGLQLEFSHEINYRHTMADIYHQLIQKELVTAPFAFLAFVILKQDCEFLSVKKSFETLRILTLSPLKKGMNIFLIEADKVEQLYQKIDFLYSKLGLSKKAVYNDSVNMLKRALLLNEH